MDRIERPKKPSPYANEAEVGDRDRPLLATPAGREPGTHNETPSVEDEEIAEKAVGARPRSDVTDIRDDGSDIETDDGLTQNEEALRQGAEDVASGADLRGRVKDMPVFDRGGLPPKV
jgi:hypothetical protein